MIAWEENTQTQSHLSITYPLVTSANLDFIIFFTITMLLLILLSLSSISLFLLSSSSQFTIPFSSLKTWNPFHYAKLQLDNSGRNSSDEESCFDRPNFRPRRGLTDRLMVRKRSAGNCQKRRKETKQSETGQQVSVIVNK